MLKHLITKDILVVLLPEHCMLKSLVLFLLLHIILGIMNNGSFLVQLTGKLIFAYVKSLVTVILLVPHCWCINLQWGLLILKKDHTQEPDSNYVQESLNLPISLKIVVCGISTCNVLINTYCYIHATLPTLTIGRNPYNADTKHYYLIVGK